MPRYEIEAGFDRKLVQSFILENQGGGRFHWLVQSFHQGECIFDSKLLQSFINSEKRHSDCVLKMLNQL